MPSAPPMLALALVVHGCGIANARLAAVARRRGISLPNDAHRGDRAGLVPRSPDRATAASSSSCRCSPTASSTPATTSRCSRRGGSRTKAKLVSPMAEPPDPRELGNAWYDAYHALASYLQVDDFDIVHDHAGIVGPICGALLQGNPPVVHTLHGPWTDHRPARSTALARRARAPRRDQRRATRRQPRRALHRHRAQRHRPRRRTRSAPRRNDVLVYIGRANPDKGPKEAITIARRAGLPAAHAPQAQRAAGAASTSSTRSSRCSRADVELLRERHARREGRAARPGVRDGLPDPLARAVRPRDGRGDGLRHAGVTTNWGAAPELVDDGVTGFRRDGDDDLVEAVGHVDALDPAACRRRVEDLFSGEAMVRGYEAVYEQVAPADSPRLRRRFPLRP